MSIPFHPLAGIFPLMMGPEFDGLVEDIRINGVRDPIFLLDGQILDGRNRYRAMERLIETQQPQGSGWGPAHEGKPLTIADLDPETTLWPFEQYPLEEYGDPLAVVISKNLHRRHLNESQRAMVAARLANLSVGRPGAPDDDDETHSIEGISVERAAGMLNVGRASVERAKIVQRGAPELVAAVEQGKLAVSAAAQAAKLDPQMQREVAEGAEAGKANVVRGVIKKAARAVREKALGEKQLALPDKTYGVILADPEWRFEPRSRETGMDRAPDNHYATSPTQDIIRRPVASIAAKDCALFLWATAPMLPEALEVMRAWGFSYKTHIVWSKKRSGNARGPGFWFTGEHELLLLGTQGAVPAPAEGTQWRSLFDAPAGKHSQKPDTVYALIEEYFPNLPKIELNARRVRPGWDRWGAEAPAADDLPMDETPPTPPIASQSSTLPTAARGEGGTPGYRIPPPTDDELDIPAFLKRPQPLRVVEGEAA